MVSKNCCPITRSSYTSLLAQILEAETANNTLSKQSLTNVERFQPSITAPHQWQVFLQYLRDPCPVKPAFASEEAAKLRCTLLVDRLVKEQGKQDSDPVNVSQSIFMKHGSDGIPEDPKHSEHILRTTGSLLAHRVKAADQEMLSTHELLKRWATALKLAQNDDAVRIWRSSMVTRSTDSMTRM